MQVNNLLFNENPLVILPELAVNIGLNEAIVLQQLHYWLQKSTKIKDGKAWVYNSVREWQEQFPFWSADTVRRSLNKLMRDGIVVKGKYNKVSFDKTIWYTIDYDALDKKIKYGGAKSIYAKCINGSMQNAEMDICNLPKPIPETNTETNTETTYIYSLFSEFYNSYPLKVNKKKAQDKYLSILKKAKNPDEKADEILTGLKRYVAFWEKSKTEKQFIPHPTTWLNGERWNDEVENIKSNTKNDFARREYSKEETAAMFRSPEEYEV